MPTAGRELDVGKKQLPIWTTARRQYVRKQNKRVIASYTQPTGCFNVGLMVNSCRSTIQVAKDAEKRGGQVREVGDTMEPVEMSGLN
jgi:hypothetical protein